MRMASEWDCTHCMTVVSLKMLDEQENIIIIE